MPRYSTRTLLIVFGLIALWLATFAGRGAAQDVRRSVLLLGLVAATCLAIFGHGKRRVFWTGFSVTMFLCGGLSMDRPLHRYVPTFAWQYTFGADVVTFQPPTLYAAPQPAPAQGPAQPAVITYAPTPYAPGMPGTYGGPYSSFAFRRPTVWLGLVDSLTAGWTLALAALSGFVATWIYSRTRPTVSPATSEASLSARQIVEQELLNLR